MGPTNGSNQLNISKWVSMGKMAPFACLLLGQNDGYMNTHWTDGGLNRRGPREVRRMPKFVQPPIIALVVPRRWVQNPQRDRPQRSRQRRRFCDAPGGARGEAGGAILPIQAREGEVLIAGQHLGSGGRAAQGGTFLPPLGGENWRPP